MSSNPMCLNCACAVDDDALLCDECHDYACLADCADCGEPVGNTEFFDWVGQDSYICEMCMN